MRIKESCAARAAGLPLALGAVLLALALLFVLPGAARATVRCENQVTWTVEAFPLTDGSTQVGPPSTDGNIVMWGQHGTTAWDLFSHPLSADGVTTQLTTASGDNTAPARADGVTAWVQDTGSGPHIWAQLDGQSPFQVSTGPGLDPATDGHFVVWQDTTDPANPNILAFNLDTKALTTVCDAAGVQEHPRVSGGLVVWADYRNGPDNADIYADDLTSTAGPFVVTDADGNQINPAVSGNMVVWQSQGECGWQIWGTYVGNVVAGEGRRAASPRRPNCYFGDGPFRISDGGGDQVNPSINGPIVAWEDQSNGAANSDIVGYDLVGHQQFVICDAAGAQTNPSVGADNGVAWLDSREGAAAVFGGILTQTKQANPSLTDDWTADNVLTFFLGVLRDLGIFQQVRFSTDNVTWTDWQPLADTEHFQLPAGTSNGPVTVYLQFGDDQGNVQLELNLVVHLDTTPPVTAANWAARVAKGHTAALRFAVRDSVSPRAGVVIKVRNRAGSVVRTLNLGQRPTRTWLTAKFLCKLPRGRYTYRVYATDLAGNRQAKAAWNWLIVR
jgi:beta propeller repeat protein